MEEGDPAELEEESLATLEFVASLIGVPGDSLPEALTVNRFYSRGEVFERPFTRAAAEDCRDALAKGLYGKTFGWIVGKINEMLQPNDIFEVEMDDRKRLIGILDIFGFEKFQVNSFEQWCINLANEQLQNYFNEVRFNISPHTTVQDIAASRFQFSCTTILQDNLRVTVSNQWQAISALTWLLLKRTLISPFSLSTPQHVFKQELEMYKKEGVTGANVTYVDNKPLLVRRTLVLLCCPKSDHDY